jgi:hypothetical protein
MPYNGSTVSDANESTLDAYRYNETLQTFVAVENSTVDTTNDTVTAETPHFSTYTVIPTDAWEARFDRSRPTKWSRSDDFSNLANWSQDGEVSNATVSATASLDTTSDGDTADRSSAVVVGSTDRPDSRNRTKSKRRQSAANSSTTRAPANATTDAAKTRTTSERATTVQTTTATTTETTTAETSVAAEATTTDTEHSTSTDTEHSTTTPTDAGRSTTPDQSETTVTTEPTTPPDATTTAEPTETDGGSDGQYDEQVGPPKHDDPDGGGQCNGECDDETTQETTNDGGVSNPDPKEDSDGDGEWDRYDDCPYEYGLGSDGCPIDSDGDGTVDHEDDCPNEVGAGDGCPSDSDDDGTRDYYDECPNTPGLKDNGCAKNTDGDQHNDYFDDCPTEAGTGPDGCPVDDDGDGTKNLNDDCPQFPGWKQNGCPEESGLERNVTLRDAETVTLGTIANAEAISDRSVAELVVIGPDSQRIRVYGEDRSNVAHTANNSTVEATGIIPGGEGDRGEFEAVEEDLSQFAGEQVTIRVVTVGRATFEIDALKIGYDSDGDGLYDSVERGSCGIWDGRGQCLDTDPYLADTDGDGLNDSEEIGTLKQVNGREYYALVSNPTVRDTDGDGLSDKQEVEGSFKTAVTRSPEASRKYLNGQSASDKREHLSRESVSSNPLKYDTDEDGLSDREEWLYKTDPKNPDSDGDGLEDGRERDFGGDPTLHDYRGPDIRPTKYGYRPQENFTKIQYVAVYYAADPSGVAKTTVTKNGDVQYSATPSAAFSRHNGSFTEPTRLVGPGLEDQIGTNVEATATDRHGNENTVSVVQRANDCGLKAKAGTDRYNYIRNHTKSGYGVCSGFDASIGSSLQAIGEFADNPIAFLTNFVTGLRQLVKLLDKSGVLDMFIEAFTSELETKQQVNNPFTKGTSEYNEYRRAWYAGYATGFITKAVYGGKITKALKSTKYFETIEDVAKSTRAGKTAMRVKAPYDRGKARVATGLAEGAKKTVGPVVGRAKSAGATYRLWKLQRQAGVDTADLSDVEQKRVARFLARHGEDGAANLRTFDDEDVNALFRRACSASGYGTQRIGGGDCTDLTDREQRVYRDAVVAADVDPSEFSARLAKTDVSTANARRAFVHTSRSGVELSKKLDDEALNQFVQLDAKSQRMVVEAWRADREVSGGKIGSDGLDIMIRQGTDVRGLGRISGLSTDETRKLLRAYGWSPEVSKGPLDDAGSLQSALEDLSKDKVDGLDEAVEDISGTKTGYKGIAGEADIANGLKGSNNDIDADDLQMEYDVEVSELPEEARENVRKSGKFKTETDIDVKVDGELTVGGKTMDSPAIESKNWKPNSGLPPEFRNDDIVDLENKLSTYAVSGEDEIIVVMEKNTIEGLDNRLQEVEGNVNEALDSLNTNADTPDQITIEFISYNELSE